jgi:gliding motility-associated-like protein
MVHVDLDDDLIILPGDTTIIQAIVNVPFDSLASIHWSGLINPDCPECLTQPVAPIITTTYSVTVTSHDGCSDEDAMTLFVDTENDIYVPNIFSPYGDNVNDRLLISAGKDVERISLFIVYDRWGDLVFEAKDFFPGDASVAWDGRLNGRFLNPGVFAYRMLVEFKDGGSEIRYGDVTLIR